MGWLHSEVPCELSVGDLLIRSWHVSDAAQLVEAVTESLPELIQWMPWARFEPQSVLQREALIIQWNKDWEEKKDFPFGIFRREQLVGCTGFHLRHSDGQLEIGYWVRTSCTGQGIATQATRTLTNAAFELPEIHDVLIAHDVGNIRSEIIPKRLGFSVLKEYDVEKNVDSTTGRNRLWSMTRNAWIGV